MDTSIVQELIVQEFILHCINNDIEKAKEFYQKNQPIININTIKYDTNVSDIQGPYSLFECMCIKNHIELVQWFIELGTNPDFYNNGFISACQYKNTDIVTYLFDNRNDIELDYQSAFIICCNEGYFELVKWLIYVSPNKIDIHIHDETPFMYACSAGHIDIAKWLYHISIIDDKMIDINADDNYAFIYSCYNGRLDMCKWLYLVSNGKIDKSMNDNMPLKNAKLSGNQELIDWLQAPSNTL